MNIKIPFLGDDIESANVISILVSPGDTIDKDQTLIELETDKATAPVPATVAGTIDKVLVKEGEIVKEGMPVVSLKGSPSSDDTAPIKEAPKQPEKTASSTVQVTQLAAPIPQTSYESTNAEVHAAPSIKQFAALSGLDLGRISGSGHGGRITWEDIQSYVAYLQSTTFNPSITPEQQPSKPVKPSIDFSKFGPIERKKITSLRQKIADHLSNA